MSWRKTSGRQLNTWMHVAQRQMFQKNYRPFPFFHFRTNDRQMNTMNAMFQQFPSTFNLRTLLKTSDMYDLVVHYVFVTICSNSPSRVQTHLSRVYMTLGTGILAASVGVYLHLLFHFVSSNFYTCLFFHVTLFKGGNLTLLGCLGVMVYLTLDSNKQDSQR